MRGGGGGGGEVQGGVGAGPVRAQPTGVVLGIGGLRRTNEVWQGTAANRNPPGGGTVPPPPGKKPPPPSELNVQQTDAPLPIAKGEGGRGGGSDGDACV